MDIGSGIPVVLTIGFLLGLKHATDADHVVAISTIVTEQRNMWRGLWIGGSWGAGHSTPLIVLGLIILALKDLVLERYEAVAPFLEFGVGIMLIFLGVQVIWNIRRGKLHIHQHSHDDSSHVHIHASHNPKATHNAGNDKNGGFFDFGKPTFRMKSYLIGVIHGLAGSAAVMLVLIPAIDSFLAGVVYLLLFSVGTMLSMSIATVILSVPFVVSGSNVTLNRAVAIGAGAMSVALGAIVMSEIVWDVEVMPF